MGVSEKPECRVTVTLKQKAKNQTWGGAPLTTLTGLFQKQRAQCASGNKWAWNWWTSPRLGQWETMRGDIFFLRPRGFHCHWEWWTKLKSPWGKLHLGQRQKSGRRPLLEKKMCLSTNTESKKVLTEKSSMNQVKTNMLKIRVPS